MMPLNYTNEETEPSPEENIPLNEKDFIERIDESLANYAHDKLAVKAVTIGTHAGNMVSAYVKPDVGITINGKEMVAATTSILFISSRAIAKISEDKFKYIVNYGPTYILICFLTRNVSVGVILDRNLAELDGIEHFITEIGELALRVSAIIEISDISQSDLFTKIKVEIPDANLIAIITKEGLPIRIQSENLDEARVSAFISAIFGVNALITDEDAEFTTVVGQDQSIIIHRIDNNRLLALSVPSGENSTLMRYVVRIKELINP
jgi:predicted regulator of Ras-like GTPase activity (Roadblock/LC7/MglB family)